MSGVFPLSLPGTAYVVQELGLVCYCLTGPCCRLSSSRKRKRKIPGGAATVYYGLYWNQFIFPSDFRLRADKGIQNSLGA